MNTFGQDSSQLSENAEAIANRIALEGDWEAKARKHTCLLAWNAGKPIPEPLADNGTCCLIQTRVGRFALTCEHVWRGYEAFRNAEADPRLWIIFGILILVLHCARRRMQYKLAVANIMNCSRYEAVFKDPLFRPVPKCIARKSQKMNNVALVGF